MSISSKLAIDFVKRNFNSFDFDNKIKNASEVTSRNVYDAHVRMSYTDIKLFDIDCCRIMVLLPEKLCGKLGLEESLTLIDKEDMDMASYLDMTSDLHFKNKYVRVTTNRLMMLEKLMKKSGLINPINPINRDMKDLIIAKIAQMKSEASATYANTFNQLNELCEMIKSK